MTNLVLALLGTERPLSLREIGAAVAGYPPEHGALRQAFERDKRTLRDGGIPVSAERIDGEDQVGYRIRPEEYYLPDLGLSEEEAEAISFALAMVRLEGATSGTLERKLGATSFDALPPIALLPALPALGALQDAIRERSRVCFTYNGRTRDVAGYGLVFKAGSWYFVGNDATAGPAGELRTFRVDRFEDQPRRGEAGSYEVPDGFSAADELRRSPFAAQGADTTTVELTVSARSVPSALSALGEASRVGSDRDGGVKISVEVADEEAIVAFLLGLGEDVVVHSPAHLRARMVAALEAVVQVNA